MVRPGGAMASLEFAVPPNRFWRAWWWLYTRAVLPLAGALLGGRAWFDVGRFLGPNITAHYDAFPVAATIAAWEDAGLHDVGLRHMSLGGGLVMWGRRSADIGPPVRASRERRRPSAAPRLLRRAGETGEVGWADWWVLLHPPYTLWHLSYVAIGAAIASRFDVGRLAATLIAFLLAVGVCAHALDELHGRPLRTHIPGWLLVAAAAGSLAGAVALGVIGMARIGPGLMVFIVVGVVLTLATTSSCSAAASTPT